MTTRAELEAPTSLAAAAAAGGSDAASRRSARRPGRPLEMTADELLVRLRRLAEEPWGLFRAHRAHPALYARARRLFGSWSAALNAAGLRYDLLRDAARARSIETRQQRRRRAALRDRPKPADASRP